jgi:hypothetical protein
MNGPLPQARPDIVLCAWAPAAVHVCSATDDGAVLGPNDRPTVEGPTGIALCRGSHDAKGAGEEKT